mgnify:CR=1 FL=1
MEIQVDSHDAALIEGVRASIRAAIAAAHKPAAVAKKIGNIATNVGMKGRDTAIKGHPFQGFCEASGLPLDDCHKELDELDPELGYFGRVRWVCRKAHTGYGHSCGAC